MSRLTFASCARVSAVGFAVGWLQQRRAPPLMNRPLSICRSKVPVAMAGRSTWE